MFQSRKRAIEVFLGLLAIALILWVLLAHLNIPIKIVFEDDYESSMDSALLHLERGSFFLHAGNPKLAIMEYEQALKHRPNWDIALENISVAKSPEEGRWKELNKRLEAARKKREEGNQEEALLMYGEIRKDFPKSYMAYGSAGSLLLSKGRFDEGLELLEEALVLLEKYEPESSNVRSAAGIMLQIGAAYLEQGNDEAAALTIRKLREMGQDSYADDLEKYEPGRY